MSHGGRALVALLAGLAAASFPHTGRAQTVAGRVLAEGDGTPLAGVYVTLSDASGATISSCLTDGGGAFSLPAGGTGSYVIRADGPGLQGSGAPVRVEPGAPPTELRLRRVVIPLDDMSTDMGKGCRVPEGTARRVTALWNETRKALAAAVLVQDQALLAYQIETWYRHLDPRRLRVLEEHRTPRPGFQATLRIPSPSAAELARDGYIRGGKPGESLVFYAPDASTLLSSVFGATHCLGFQDDAPEGGWVGLRFRPLDEQAREVEGTLWIDAHSYEPRRLEFRYTELPWPLRTDKVGGGIEFTRLTGGALIMKRWWLRMPRVGVRATRITQWAAPRKRYSLEGVVEEGGRVLRVRAPDGSIEEMR